eukprot:403339812
MLMLISLLFLGHQILSVNSVITTHNCFQAYPLSQNDLTTGMYFTAVDMDNLSNIVLGGTKNLMIPTLSYFSPNQALNWQKQITGLPSGSMYREVTVVKFQHQVDNSPYLLVLLPKTNTLNATLFLQINSHTGAVVQAFREFTPYTLSSTTYYGILGQITSQKVLYLNTGDIYVTGISMLNQQLNFARFSISSSFVSVQTIYSHSTYQSKGMTLTMTQDQNFVILGAEFNLDPGYELTLHKSHRTNLASVQWELNVAILGPLQDLQISHLGTSSNDYIFGSMAYLNQSNSNFIGTIFFVQYSQIGYCSISHNFNQYFSSYTNNNKRSSFKLYINSKYSNPHTNKFNYAQVDFLYSAQYQVHGVGQSINVKYSRLMASQLQYTYPIDFIDCRDVYITELLIENQVFVLNQEMTQTLIYKAPIYSKDMCSQYIELTVTFRNGSVIPSSFMSSDLANNKLIFNTSEQSYLGTHALEFTLNSLMDIGNILSGVSFEVSILDNCQVKYNYPGPLSFTYYLGRLEKISFQDLEFYSNCDFAIQIKPYKNPENPLPSFIRYSRELKEFNIYTNDQHFKGMHQIQIKATLDTDRKIENSTFIWTLIIEDDPIQFGFSLEPSDQIAFVGQESFYELPSVVNPFNESYEVKTEITNIKAFAKFDGSTFSFFPYLMDIGEYTLEVSLLNLRRPQKSKIYTFKLQVNQQNFTNQQTQQVYTTEIKQASNFQQNFKAKVKSISFQGLLTVQFYDDWLYSEINQNFLNIKIEYRFLKRALDSSLYERNEFIQDWKYVQYKNKILQVQLNFSRPSYISNQRFSNLKTNLRRQLVEGDSREKKYVIKKEIPQQLDQDEAQAIAQAGNAISAAMTASVYINFILQFFLSAALSIIWGALNNMQLITHLPLFQINFTSNFRYFVLFLIDISNLNLIPTPDFLTENLQFNQEDTVDEDYQLEDMYKLLGYENCFFPSNLANLIVNFLAIIALMVVERIIKRGLTQKQQKLETVQINSEKDASNSEKPSFIKQQIVKAQQKLQQKYVNELTFLTALYFCFLFTDFISNPDTQQSLGYLLIYIVLANILINLLLVLYTITQSVYQLIQKIMKKLRANQQRSLDKDIDSSSGKEKDNNEENNQTNDTQQPLNLDASSYNLQSNMNTTLVGLQEGDTQQDNYHRNTALKNFNESFSYDNEIFSPIQHQSLKSTNNETIALSKQKLQKRSTQAKEIRQNDTKNISQKRKQAVVTISPLQQKDDINP